MNRLALRAQLVERGALRYTPAGLPALDLVLRHESQQTQAGGARKVSLEIRALAIGELVQQAALLAVGAVADFEGFVANARNGRGVVFHLSALAAVTHPN